MRRLHWKDTWTLGEPRLDGQHQAMVEALDHLAEAMAAGRPKRDLERLAGMLCVHVETHMRHEEALMARTGYPGAAGHRLRHGVFARRLEALAAGPVTGDLEGLEDLVSYLSEWLPGHLEQEDRALATFLKK